MVAATTIHVAIRSELIKQGPCTLESLLNRLPQFSWSEIFSAIDQLSRTGEVVLRHQARFDYEVAMSPTWPIVQQLSEQSDEAVTAVYTHANVDQRVYDEGSLV